MLTNYFTGHIPAWQGQIQYFGKGPGFEFYDLIKLALVEYENGGGGGGGREGFEIQELRRNSPKWRSDSNFMPQTSLHNRSNLSNPTRPLG